MEQVRIKIEDLKAYLRRNLNINQMKESIFSDRVSGLIELKNKRTFVGKEHYSADVFEKDSGICG